MTKINQLDLYYKSNYLLIILIMVFSYIFSNVILLSNNKLKLFKKLIFYCYIAYFRLIKLNQKYDYIFN